MKSKQEDPKEMVGGCCVCSDENGWAENPLVYCDGQGCNVAVHQACYGIVSVPTGSWFCRKCESQERSARVRCELCPSKDGALKRTDSGGWAHVVCALYIPEVRFGNVTTMEPIMLQLVPPERFNKICYICDDGQKGSAASSRAQIGACMQCNRQGCKNHFHVTCAQSLGLLCEEAGNYLDNVKYCGYCSYHFSKLKKGSTVKTIPPYRPVSVESDNSDSETNSPTKTTSDASNLELNTSNSADTSGDAGSDSKDLKHKKRSKFFGCIELKSSNYDVKPNLSEISGPSKPSGSSDSSGRENELEHTDQTMSVSSSVPIAVKVEPKGNNIEQSNSSYVPNCKPSASLTKYGQNSSSTLTDANINSIPSTSSSSQGMSASCSSTVAVAVLCSAATAAALDSATVSSASSSNPIAVSSQSTSASISSTEPTLAVSTVGTTFSCSSISSSRQKLQTPQKPQTPSVVTSAEKTKDKERESIFVADVDKQKKVRRSGSKSLLFKDPDGDVNMTVEEENASKLSSVTFSDEKINKIKSNSEEVKLNVQFTPNVSSLNRGMDSFRLSHAESSGMIEPVKRARSNSQDKGRRNRRGGGGGGAKRGRATGTTCVKEARDSGASSPEPFLTEPLPVKRSRGGNRKHDIKDFSSVIANGLTSNALLLGNQINPASSVAQKMADTLHAELEAHSIYKEEDKVTSSLIGPTLPGKKENSISGTVLNNNQPPPLPQSLEQLLERQWEQGSQFLMEQAQHFDIASLLSCLHQLRQENVRLEDTVNTLVARRDHLLAVNARLSVPLNSNSSSPASGSAPSLSTATIISASSLSTHPSSSTSVVSITPTGPPPPSSTASAVIASGHLNQIVSQHSGVVTVNNMPPRPASQGRHPSGGNVVHPHLPMTTSGRGSSPHDRRVGPQQMTPIENGLGEPEYRYRSPSSGGEHQHRQQSPMRPPATQQSPSPLRHSPASINYHSGSSPHSVVPSLSPSNLNHPMPPHTHGHPPIMVSQTHAPSHTVSLSRGIDHSRAELVRLSSHSTGGVAYPIYQMVSPPVHHSQAPSHTQQVMRREVVDVGRANHLPLEKR